MDFYDVLDQVIALLQRRGRVTYRALQLQFALDDNALEVLKDELIDAQRLAVDEQGKILVWTGDQTSVPRPPSESAPGPGPTPLSYIPPYLTEKILASRAALEGERKQVTVLFADLKGSTELIAGLDPEAARTLLDPALHHMMDAVHRYEGTVNQVLGDGIMALFGAPLAHEDEALSEGGLRIVATFNLGRTYHHLGDYSQAIAFLRRSAEALVGDLLRERFGQAYLPSVFSRVWLALSLAEVGAFDEGLAMGEEGLRIAEAVDHPLSCIGAYWGVGYVSLRKGDFHQAIPFLEHALEFFQVAQAPVWFLIIVSTLSLAYALSGRRAEALGLLEPAPAVARVPTQTSRIAVFAFNEVFLWVGHLEEASAYTREVLALARTGKERGNEAWTLRLLGDIAAQHEPPEVEPAEDYYRQALALAEELGMRPLQAHCHFGLGTLYAKTCRREQARAELTAATDLYRTMEMAFWLPQVEAVLAQVVGL